MGAILEMKTGKNIYELFFKEIARPLGMNDYNGRFSNIDGESEDSEIPDTDGFYQYERSKSKYPAYHFRMSTRDLMLYAQLYLNYGSWNGNQLISREWIDKSTFPYSVYNQDYGLSYGMLWNVIIPDESTKRNSFFHTGAGIHMLGVYPDLNMVFVHRVDTENNADYEPADLYKMLDLMFDSGINN